MIRFFRGLFSSMLLLVADGEPAVCGSDAKGGFNGGLPY
jgi:hypothetical protein